MFAPLFAVSLASASVWFAIITSVFGLLVALFLIKTIINASPGNERMRQIAGAIEEGAKAYLGRQVRSILVIAVIIVLLVAYGKDIPTAIGFIVGAACSLVAGFIGMRVAVISNVRTAQAATIGSKNALRVAFNGGAVTGLLVVGLALLSIGLFWMVINAYQPAKALSSLVGVALGASLISVFARLGGGIYTKAADVGADLVGKVEQNLDEDDPRNPATIADNVGDNVGDCAGMAADVFETYAVSLVGAILVGSLTAAATGQAAAVAFPFLLGGIAIVASILGILFVNKTGLKPAGALLGGVAVSGLLCAAAFYPATRAMFPDGLTVNDILGGGQILYSANQLYLASLVGLVMTVVAVAITNYYTSTEYSPVRKIAKSSETGHATNIIEGLAMGQHATALPVLAISASIWLSYSCGGLYGIAIAVMAMLSMAGIIISLDAFGPITDNAGGIATMSKMPDHIREVTDELDAVGNTMKAVTKGYAIASAGLAAVVLFGSYYVELKHHLETVRNLSGPALETALSFSLKDPKVIIGLFIGGLLPYLFAAFSMSAVGRAAGAVVSEVRRQIAAKPGILTGKDTPDYGVCVDIVTKAALKEMIVPALFPIVVVILVALIQNGGPTILGGVLVGSIVTGLFLGISMTSSGGAWDNAKKYIEEGHHGGKHSEAHKASVTGDTVGDPYKDTAGPAINPMIKVVNIVAILIIPIFF